MPASRATAFDRLAPDQRAAVELVLRQGRSYGELSDLLGMPEETIRTRARGGLAALAPDLPAPARSAEISDWLLGQQAPAHAARTRELLLTDPDAHRWAATVVAPLRDVPGGEAVPELPTGPGDEKPRVNGKTARKAAAVPATTVTDEDAVPDGDEPPPPTSPERDAVPGGRSSRLGGALLIGAAVIIVGAVLAFVLLRGDDDPGTQTASETPAATATATPVSTVVGANDVLLRGPAGSTSVGLMRLFQANDESVRFALAAQGVAPNAAGETYSIWFTREKGAPRLLGDVKDPVGEDGELTSAGPGNDDVDEFVSWLQTYDAVVVTLDEPNAKEPGKVILKGDLPEGTG